MLSGAAFSLVFGALIGKLFNYLSIGIASGISLGIVIGSKINRNCLLKKNQLSGITAGAVASIIILKQNNIEKIELDIIIYKK